MFYGCSSLVDVNIPDSVQYISDYAFYKCESLEKISLSDNTKEIGNYAFSGCLSLKSVKLPASLTHISKQLFRNCKQLTSLVIPESVESIAAHAFYGCDNMTIYVEAQAAQENWSNYWNTSYRPAVFGVTLSADGSYVTSFTKLADNIINANSLTQIVAPQREGYEFVGWTTVEGGSVAEYTANQLSEVAKGTTVYAIWSAK
jgi:uncharacterized repeat protein (TIGR02543 family)